MAHWLWRTLPVLWVLIGLIVLHTRYLVVMIRRVYGRNLFTTSLTVHDVFDCVGFFVVSYLYLLGILR